jgi:hypothetical protein
MRSFGYLLVLLEGVRALAGGPAAWIEAAPKELLPRSGTIEDPQDLDGRSVRRSYSATLVVPRDADPIEVAREFADPSQLERVTKLIGARLSAAGSTGPIRIDLAEILPRYARERLDAYPPAQGPNCRSAALCFPLESVPPGEEKLVTDAEMKQALAEGYRPVSPGEPLKVGDIVAYADPDGRSQIRHAVRFVGQARDVSAADASIELYFTKNGMGFQSPYVLMSRQQLEAAAASQFRRGISDVLVYRAHTASRAASAPAVPRAVPQVIYERRSLGKEERCGARDGLSALAP